MSDERCKSGYDFERVALSEGITPDTIFCAGGKEDKDTCQVKLLIFHKCDV